MKPPAAVELPAAAEAFLAQLHTGRRASPHTGRAYRRDLGMLAALAQAAGTTLAATSAADIRRFAARLHAQGQRPSSIARTLSAWRSFYRWWIEHEPGAAPAGNPVEGVRAPRRGERLPRALTVEQAVRLAGAPAAAAPLALRDRALVELLYSSGLRLAELVGLDWRPFPAERHAGHLLPASAGYLDLAARSVTVTGKGRRTRAVPVGAAAAAALRDWLAVRGTLCGAGERALFVSRLGRRLSAASVEARVARLARATGLGVHVHPHMLRHSMASHVLQSSGDLRAVQELLGHASVSSTQIYTRLDWQHLARAYDAAHPRARRAAPGGARRTTRERDG